MLILEDIKEKMKKHFPRWMDIRRKINSSIGGNYLSSVAEELTDIQEAIDEYKRDFFIDNYYSRNEILDFLYKVSVGSNDVKIISPDYKLTDDEDLFYTSDNYIYLNDGNLYLKELIDVTYSIDGYNKTVTPEKIHVWNIYDEFAVFLGLRRYQWETNQELLNRILTFNKKKSNSTIDGLKHALISNLINIAELTDDDIQIEQPTADNLIQYYDNFEKIVDYLSHINKDVYKEKSWDIDTWNFDINSIDYIPHAWDIILEDYINGIGDNNDLLIEKIEEDKKTDLNINFYKKDVNLLNNYIHQFNKEKEFKLNLIKYNEVLKDAKVNYQLTASETAKINPNNISFKSVENKTGSFDLNLQDIIKSIDTNDFMIVDNSILDSQYNYVLDFIPINSIGNFQIDYCKQLDNYNKQTNLLDYESYLGFERIGDGIRSTACKKYITELYQLTEYNNINNNIDGLKLIDISKPASFTIDIDGLQGRYLYYDFTINEGLYNLEKINMYNVYFNNNKLISDTVTDDKYIEISDDLNSFSFDINGPYKITYSIDKEQYELYDELNTQYHFSIPKQQHPIEFKIKIECLAANTEITDIKYSKFDINISTSNGNIIKNNNVYILPGQINNNLIFDISVYRGYSPIINYVYIGNLLTENNGYYNIKFNPNNGNKLLVKYSNCRLRLKKYKDDELIETIEDYYPYNQYLAVRDTTIEIDLSNYVINTLDDRVRTEDINSIYKKYFIDFKEGQQINTINVVGTSYIPIVNSTLSSVLLNKNYEYYNYEWFITKNESAIIGRHIDTKDIVYVHIYKDDLFNNHNFNNLSIESEYICKFITLDKNTTYTNLCDFDFDEIAFEPKDASIYYAVNSSYLLTASKSNIPIVNTFNNNFTDNSKTPYHYTIESLSDSYTVEFSNNLNKCLDKNTINIAIKNINDFNFNYETKEYSFISNVNKLIELPDLTEYVVESDYNIVYDNKYTDSNYLDYIFTETITVNNNKITKLKKSNIKEIEYISVDNTKYTLINDKGIIIWNLEPKTIVTITYNINKPAFIELDIDELYESIGYPVNSLRLIDSVNIKNKKNNDIITISTYDSYKNADLTTVEFLTSGFNAKIINGVIHISIENKNNYYLNNGYYYYNGREYYFFNNEYKQELDPDSGIKYHNVIKDNKELIMRKKSNNYISNTKMILDTKGEIYKLFCEDKELLNISKMNELTACETFNAWTCYNSDINITKGYNGNCINITTKDKDAYCYLKLSDYIDENKEYYLSFYFSGSAKLYLGKARKINSEFNYESIIDIVRPINKSVMDSIYDTKFINDRDYYLIINGSGNVDDILLIDSDKYNIYNHNKNINLLNLDIIEDIYSEYQQRLYIMPTKGCIHNGTEFDEDDNLINSSNIKWGYTRLKSITTKNDFDKCILKDVGIDEYNNICTIKTDNKIGSIETPPIALPDLRIVKTLLYKINSVALDNFKNIKVTVYGSNNRDNGYIEIFKTQDLINYLTQSNLYKFIKLKIEIPKNAKVNNIDFFIEYMSDDKNAPVESDVMIGSYISSVIDTQFNSRYMISKVNLITNSSEFKIQVRATKENANNTVWTDWKDIELDKDYKIKNRLIFDNYRYFQFRVIINGKDIKLKVESIDIEVI